MTILIAFAFLAGVVTILSPCILPILPVILSSSVSGSRSRPLGIVLGFVLSFTFFTLFLAGIVKATGLSADVLRTVSVVIIFVFGLVLIVPQAQVLFEKLASRIAARGSAMQSGMQGDSTGGGFYSGIVIGVSLGLIWTPCVGPILAAVISLALTGSVSGTAVLITLAYSLGTAIPMLGILYGGRTLMQKVPWLLNNTGKIQKVFGVLMILTALAIHFNYDRQFQTYILEKFPNYGAGLTQFEENEAVQKQLDALNQNVSDENPNAKQSDLAPEIISGGEWFNSEPLKISELRGKVVLVDFWTYTCINCVRTLPYLRNWHEKYADDGLVIIGVHTPEFEFEKNPDNLAKAIEDYELKYPIVQDNDYATWRAYNNRYWPAKYLIDQNGTIRYRHFGEGEYDETEEMIRKLLGESGVEMEDAPVANPEYNVYSRTPELYLGYDRLQYLTSSQKVAKDQEKAYAAPAVVETNRVAFSGDWTVNRERAVPAAGAALQLNFEAKNAFLVMRPARDDTASKVNVFLDDTLVTTLTIDSDQLYQLVSLPEPGRHLLRLEFPDGGVELYAFTFG